MRSLARCLAPLAISLAAALPALAGDAAARRVLGFSPDGAVFAFEQHTVLYDSLVGISEYVFIDTLKDRYLPGTPFRERVDGDRDENADYEQARPRAAARAKPLIERHRIAEAGRRIEGRPSMALDDVEIYQTRTEPMGRSLEFTLAGGRKARLTLADLPLGSATCDGAGGRATPGRAPVAGFRLTLAVDGKEPIILNEDRRLPAGRRCAQEYGIAEAYVHQAPDGAETLAVLVEYADAHEYHAGPNRRFLAVTRRLSKP